MTNDQHLNNFCNEIMYRSVMFLARFITFYKDRRGIVTTCSSSSARLRLRPEKFWGKLLRQKNMSSFISSLTQNLFIFAMLIHMVVLIDNHEALMNIHLYYFSYFFHVLAMFQLRKYLVWENC